MICCLQFFCIKCLLFYHVLSPACQSDVKILWILSRIGIEGNKEADEIANRVFCQSVIYETACFPQGITLLYSRLKSILISIVGIIRKYFCDQLTVQLTIQAIINSLLYCEYADPAECISRHVSLSVDHLLAFSSSTEDPLNLDYNLFCPFNFFCYTIYIHVNSYSLCLTINLKARLLLRSL